jgi:hypothetical protein
MKLLMGGFRWVKNQKRIALWGFLVGNKTRDWNNLYAEVFGGLKNKIEIQYGGSLVGGEEAATERMKSGTKTHYGKILGG